MNTTIHTPLWLPYNAPAHLLHEPTPEQLSITVKDVLSGRPLIDPLLVPLRLMDAIRQVDPDMLEDLHRQPPTKDDAYAGLPGLLWNYMLQRAGIEIPRAELLGICDREDPYPCGIRRGNVEEWWRTNEVRTTGAEYGHQLMAWGVASRWAIPHPSTCVSPRTLWRAHEGEWVASPHMKEILEGLVSKDLTAPPLHRGPGALLAATVRGIRDAEILQGLRPAERGALWATYLLPILALTTPGTLRRDSDAPEAVSPLLTTLPFYALHPRVQAIVICLDSVCTMVFSERISDIQQVCVDAGLAVANESATRSTVRLIRKLIELLFENEARGGFGLEVVQGALRDAGLWPAQAVRSDTIEKGMAGWDEQVHGHNGLALARRLKDSLKSALARRVVTSENQEPSVVQAVVNRLVWAAWIERR